MTIKAYLRIFAFEVLLKGMPAIATIGQDYNSTYNELLSKVIMNNMRDFLKDYKPKEKLFDRLRKDGNSDKVFYYTFLEQACQIYQKRFRSGLIRPTIDEARAMNELDNFVVKYKDQRRVRSSQPSLAGMKF